jgi:hypothetical protein
MPIQRLESVGIVVDKLAAATGVFFIELGLTVLGEGLVEGDRADRVVGLEGAVRVDVAMLGAPGHPRTARTDDVPRPLASTLGTFSTASNLRAANVTEWR